MHLLCKYVCKNKQFIYGKPIDLFFIGKFKQSLDFF